ncbi:hypothetical protein PG987_008911 [Apiospora arundinis]
MEPAPPSLPPSYALVGPGRPPPYQLRGPASHLGRDGPPPRYSPVSAPQPDLASPNRPIPRHDTGRNVYNINITIVDTERSADIVRT